MDKKVIIELTDDQIKHLKLENDDKVVIEKFGKHLLIKNEKNISDIYDLFVDYQSEE